MFQKLQSQGTNLKKYVLGLVLVCTAIIFFLWWSNRVTHLEPPLLKADKTTVGRQATLSGVAYPNARIALYLDGQFVQDSPVSRDGSFQTTVTLSKEGTNEVKVKQVYGSVASEFSGILSLQVDLTPPDKNSFRLDSPIPSFSKEPSLTIAGKADASGRVLVNNVAISVGEDGSFSGDIPLTNGQNILEFSLSDEVGNSVVVETHKLVVDAIPPRIATGFCTSNPNPSHTALERMNPLDGGEEFLCLYTGQWESWQNPAPIPIIGYKIGDFETILVGGKQIYPDENDEIYQRVYLPVPKGLNKYKVIATDKYGNRSSTNLTMTVERVQEDGYDDVMDRLDDIESQIYDME